MAFLEKDDQGFERIVYAEVLIPGVLNAHGDYHTLESIREFAFGFAQGGFGIDVDHDNIDRSENIKVVESFIAKEGDPNFIPGSWVVGMHIGDDDTWQKILNGEINGYSYEAFVKSIEVDVEMEDKATIVGRTQPDPIDGHTHEYFALLDLEGRVLTGGTTETDGHSHTISRHTFTDDAAGHSHIFNIVGVE